LATSLLALDHNPDLFPTAQISFLIQNPDEEGEKSKDAPSRRNSEFSSKERPLSSAADRRSSVPGKNRESVNLEELFEVAVENRSRNIDSRKENRNTVFSEGQVRPSFFFPSFLPSFLTFLSLFSSCLFH